MGATYPYDVDKTATLVGFIPVVGFAGDRVSVEFNTDNVETVMGADGNGRHIIGKDKSGKVTITLEHGSPSNVEFEAIRLAGVPVPILIKDNSNLATMFETGDAMIQKQPGLGLGAKPKDLDWVFTFIKGNLLHSPAKTY